MTTPRAFSSMRRRRPDGYEFAGPVFLGPFRRPAGLLSEEFLASEGRLSASSFNLDVGPVRLQTFGLDVVLEKNVQDGQQALSAGLVLNRDKELHPPFEVSRHPIGA